MGWEESRPFTLFNNAFPTGGFDNLDPKFRGRGNAFIGQGQGSSQEAKILKRVKSSGQELF